MFKKILLVFGILLVIGLTILCFIASNKQIEVGVIKKAYNNLTKIDESDYLEVYIYLNQQSSYITDIDLIESSNISSEDELVNCQIIGINLMGEERILNKTYYLYSFNMLIAKAFSDKLVLEDARLNIDYANGRSIDLSIGSVSLNKVDNANSFNHLNLNQVKAIISDDDKPFISGILLKFDTKKEVTIKSVKVMDCNVCVNGQIVCSNEKIDNTNINEYLDHEYNAKDFSDVEMNYKVSSNDFLLLTLGYKGTLHPYSFALDIEYEVDGKMYHYYTDKMVLYKSYNYKISYNDFTIYEYEYY